MEVLVGELAFGFETSYSPAVDDAISGASSSNNTRQSSGRGSLKRLLRWRNLTNRQFHKHYRMSKDCFVKLVEELLACSGAATHFPKPGEGTNPSSILPPEERALLGLWYLATPDTIRSISQNFDIAMASVFDSTSALCSLLTELEPKYVTWPTDCQMKVDVDRIWERSRIAGVVGAVDGMHARISRPSRDERVYYNRKKQFSLNVMITVDSSEKIIYYSVGSPGSFHDARVYRASGLPEKLNQLHPERHILGDSAYKLKPKCIVPYKDTGRLSAAKRQFNRHHSSARIMVEHAFSRLKQKWRRCYDLQVRSIPRAKLLLRGCFVLHNFILIQDSVQSEAMNSSPVVRLTSRMTAYEKRDKLCEMV